jgi:hypothetical protein
MKGNRVIIVVAAAAAVLVGLGAWIALDISANARIVKIPDLPEKPIEGGADALLAKLERGGAFDPAVDGPAVLGACRYVQGRYDCSDFRLQSMLRILYLHADALDAAMRQAIEETLLGFSYWMDQGDPNSMCYWSENHQVLFAASEYLAGRLMPEAVFIVDGKTGTEHAAMARARLLAWLSLRWRFGFSEWYSNTYYVEDIAPLANLADFAGVDRGAVPGDREVAVKAAIVLDLLLYDLASQSFRGSFVSSMGRAYENGKKGGDGDSMRPVSEFLWGYDRGPERIGMDLNFTLAWTYRAPAALLAVGRDVSTVVVKASSGLDVDELRDEGLVGQRDSQIMMQWGMEAFTNPPVIVNSVRYAHRHGMFANAFLNDLAVVNVGVLRATGLLGPVNRLLHPVTDGVAIQRANVYTLRTPRYQLSTAQRHHPGEYGDQQHIWSANLPGNFAVFTTHPAAPLAARGALSESPGYWVGNGRNPDAAQDGNSVLAIYAIPEKKGFMERSLVGFTHAYFPLGKFDEATVEGRYAFGRSGDAYLALVAREPLAWAEGSNDDLVQQGRLSYWICEMGSPETDASFAAFRERIRASTASFEPRTRTLTWESSGRSLRLAYGAGFTVDGAVVDTDYPRFDSPWVRAEREPKTLTIRAGGAELFLDFDSLRRDER